MKQLEVEVEPRAAFICPGRLNISSGGGWT